MTVTLPVQRLPLPREFVRMTPAVDRPAAVLVAALSTILLGQLVVGTLLADTAWAVFAVGAVGLGAGRRVHLSVEARAVRWATVSTATCLVVLGLGSLVTQHVT